MKRSKTFDAVEMKNAIQATHRRERASMSDEQVRQLITERLGSSDHPLARKWRRVPADQSRPSAANA